LTEYLKEGQIGGFAADVLAQEPPTEEEPLIQLNNVLITPHTASLTTLTFDEMCVLTVQNTLDLLYGKSINEKYIYNLSI
jgi:D-3-phosphoglycerate dehydrogenase